MSQIWFYKKKLISKLEVNIVKMDLWYSKADLNG